MRHAKFLFAVALAGLAVAGTRPAGNSPTPAADPHADALRVAHEAMNKVKGNDLPAAFGVLRAHGIWPEGELKELERIITESRERARERFGEPVGEVEFLAKETAGRSLVQFAFLEKLQRHVFVWRMTFYRPESRWMLSELNLDDKPGPCLKPGGE